MNLLRTFPFKRKLMVLTMVASGSALLLAAAIFVIFEQTTERRQMVQTLEITAAMTAANSTVGSSFEKGSAERALKSFSAQPDIVEACSYDKDGRPLARYQRAGAKLNPQPPPLQRDGHRFERGRLELYQTAKQAGAIIGTIYVAEDLSQMRARIWDYGMMGTAVLLVSAGVAFLLSLWLQEVVSRPLSDVAQTVALVRANRDYSARASRPKDDELGGLIDGFNEMLAQIQERDAHMEKRVAKRTAELAQTVSLLNATLESTADGILVVDRLGQVTSYNARFVEMWRLPREKIVAGHADGEMLPLAIAQLKDATGFLAKVQELYSQPEAESFDVIELKDGRTLERYSQPQRLAGECVGRVWSFRDVTGQKKIEREIVESRNFLGRIINSISDPIFVKDRQHQCVLVNDAYCQLMACRREAALGKLDHDHQCFGDGQTDVRRTRDDFVFETGKENINEEQFTASDGIVHYIVTKKTLYTDEKGEKFIVGVIRDMTRRHRAEEALRDSEANYYSLVDQMPAGVFRKDKEGRFIFVNSWFCKFRSAKPQDYLGKLPQEVAAAMGGPGLEDSGAAELFAGGMRNHLSIMRTGQPVVVEEKYVLADGKTVYQHVVKSPVFDADGHVAGSQGILLDITERKLAEAELAHERDLLRILLENSTDAIYFKDAQSRFIKSSDSEARKFGVERAEELVGKTDFDFFSDEHARPAFEDEQEIIRTGQPIIGKIEQETWKDGRPVNWVLTTKMPFRNKSGEIIGTFGISKDITAIKEAEARLETAHHQLLETSRLAGMAEVATSVLHNVGNVLNSINVSTTLVLELVKKSRLSHFGRLAAMVTEQRENLAAFFTTDPRGKQLPDYLAKLAEQLAAEQAALIAEIELTRKNVEHVKDIVTMQQNYAKVSGVVEKVRVTDLVEDALRMNAGALTRHQVQTILDYPSEAIECNIERQKVLQILINLIRNAKYACDESGRPDKRLTMHVGAAGGRVQIITVDNGVGIPAENMTRIFNHGFTTREHGHGFGLHSGALAAKELGGSLSAYSDGPGTGARFVLDLPLQPPQQS